MTVFRPEHSLRVESTPHASATPRGYGPQGSLDALLAADDTLAIVAGAEDEPADDPRVFSLCLDPLVAPCTLQVLRSSGPVRTERIEGVTVACDSGYLFAWVQLAGRGEIEHATETAYARLLVAARSAGYPHLLRMWNVIDDITAGDGDVERYRRFCVGRYRAFARHARVPVYPAATAVGCSRGPSRVALLASRYPAAAIENPAQTSAFRYPREYGPVSPSFTRASLLHTPDRELVLVSGTAAILGHKSCHDDDAVAQARMCLDNIERVIVAAGGGHGALGRGAGASVAYLRVYLRRPDDAHEVMRVVHERAQVAHAVDCFRADLCRRELLTEIEAVLSWRVPSDSRER